MKKSSLRNAGLCFLSAALLILAHPPYHFWFLAWFALVPLFWVIEGASFKESFGRGYLFGLFYCFGMFWWFVHVTLPGMILLNMFLALYFAAFAATSGHLSAKTLTGRALLAACAWAAWEFIRARFLSGFGWAALGHSQYQLIPLIQIADIAGTGGVSFVLVVVNYFFYTALRQQRTRCYEGRQVRGLLVVSCSLVGVVLIYGFCAMILWAPSADQPLRLALIQPNIQQRHKWDPDRRADILDQLKILSAEAAKETPDIIVWPESALPGAPYDLAGDMKHVERLAARLGIPIMAGYVREERGTYYNTAGLISKHGALLRKYDKLHLVPFGEFIPLRGWFPFLSRIVPIDDLTPGRGPVVFFDGTHTGTGLWPLSVLICFEDTVDGVARKMVHAGAEILLNVTNDAWFHDTKAPWLHLQAAVFQAVSYKRPLARSANTGISAVVSATGEVREIMRAYDGKAAFRAGFLVAEVFPAKGMTGRALFGDIFAYLCIATLLANVMINIKSTKSVA